MGKIENALSSSQIIILGFAAVILLGTILLMLPFATQDGMGASFADALFTATSAVCVTGLVVQDTATYWSTAGQTVILLLIQIGGLGVVTLAVTLFSLAGREISLKQRSTMQEAISAPHMGGIVREAGFIVRMAMLIELAGAVAMAPVFVKEFGIGKGVFYSVFHSVSAFCNAGFDLMGVKSPYSSLTDYASDSTINLAVMALIITGGIGFMTWNDVRRFNLRLVRYSMQSKVVLMTTLVLIILPAGYFYLFEFAEMPFKTRIWCALFQAVTPRTAGFNTADLTQMSETGLALIIMLMLVGGSPGSTAGGMKTTTLAIMFSATVSVFRRRAHVQFFNRRIDEDTTRRAMTILTSYMIMAIGGAMAIAGIERISLMSALFETASAVGTVGLTLGVTPRLGMVSRMILVVLMYCGRVGGLTLVFAALRGSTNGLSRLPMEHLTVG